MSNNDVQVSHLLNYLEFRSFAVYHLQKYKKNLCPQEDRHIYKPFLTEINVYKAFFTLLSTVVKCLGQQTMGISVNVIVLKKINVQKINVFHHKCCNFSPQRVHTGLWGHYGDHCPRQRHQQFCVELRRRGNGNWRNLKQQTANLSPRIVVHTRWPETQRQTDPEGHLYP